MRLALIFLLLASAPAAAFNVHVKTVRSEDAIVRASIEIGDPLSDRFKRVLEEAGVLHLRVQAELWESRPLWDRLVYPAIVRVYEITRGNSARNRMPVTLDLGSTARVVSTGKYYVHVIATLGTLAEREADEVGDAVFGRENETNGLGALGRLIVRTAIEVSDYMHSVSAETKSRRLSGAEIVGP